MEIQMWLRLFLRRRHGLLLRRRRHHCLPHRRDGSQEGKPFTAPAGNCADSVASRCPHKRHHQLVLCVHKLITKRCINSGINLPGDDLSISAPKRFCSDCGSMRMAVLDHFCQKCRMGVVSPFIKLPGMCVKWLFTVGWSLPLTCQLVIVARLFTVGWSLP